MVQRIDENSTYEEAFEVSKKMIRLLWKSFQYKDKMEYDDFEQELAIEFWMRLAPNFSPFDACNICGKAYRWAVYRISKRLKNVPSVVRDEALLEESTKGDLDDNIAARDWLNSNPLGLKSIDWKICQLLMNGFSLQDISRVIGLAFNTVQKHMTAIRKTTAKYYGIENYQNKHRTYKISDETRERLKGANHHSAKKCGAYKDGVLIKTWDSVRMAQNELNTTGIFQAIKTGYKCKGYEWKYE